MQSEYTVLIKAIEDVAVRLAFLTVCKRVESSGLHPVRAHPIYEGFNTCIVLFFIVRGLIGEVAPCSVDIPAFWLPNPFANTVSILKNKEKGAVQKLLPY